MKLRHIFTPLILFCIFLSGCVSDISHNARYPTDYIVGATYQIKKPLFVEKNTETIFGYYGVTLWEPSERSSWLPPSLSEYSAQKERWPSVLGIADQKTYLKISKIKLERNPEIGNTIWVYGNLIGTPWDKERAQLRFISQEQRDEQRLVNIPMVNRAILELIQKP